MPRIVTKNNATSTLAVAVSTTGQTTAQVQSGDGAKFPDLTPGHWFFATLSQAGSETSWEIVKCTALSTDTFTIERGKEGTTAATWLVGDKFELRQTDLLINWNSRPWAERQIGVISPIGASLSSLGIAIGSVTVGTIAGYTPVAGSTLAAQQKAVLFTATGHVDNTNGLGYRSDNDAWAWRAGVQGHGGFYLRFLFTVQDVVAGNRLFVGATQRSTLCTIDGATEPSADGTDMFGIGCDSGDTNITIFSRNNVSTTKTPLTTPISFVSMLGKLYDLKIECEPGIVSAMRVKLVEWNTSDVRTVLHDGTVSATLPRADILMRIQWAMGQGTDTAASRTMRLSRIYAEFPTPVSD